MAEEMFKTTLMGGFDKDDVLAKVKNIKDEAYAEKSKLIKAEVLFWKPRRKRSLLFRMRNRNGICLWKRREWKLRSASMLFNQK